MLFHGHSNHKQLMSHALYGHGLFHHSSCYVMNLCYLIYVLDDESLTSASLENDRGFIIKKYSLHW